MSAILQTPPPQPAVKLLTAEEFFQQYENKRFELVAGQAVEVPMPNMKHGVVCGNVAFYLKQFVMAQDLGRVMTNDTLMVTRRDPDSMRGADVCYLSFEKLPRGQGEDGPIPIPPELVIEVRSPSDLWTDAIAKMLEYVRTGVEVVVVLDPPTESASVFRSGHRQDIFEKDETLVIPDVLPGFAVPVAKFFE